MNKNELISTMAGASNLSQAQCTEALHTFIETVTEELKKGSDVKIIGFGTFKISKRKATTGRNPQTGATIQIGASKSVGFKAGKALKESL